MKKALLSAVLILLTSFVFSQGPGGSPKFTNDISIYQNDTLNERNVKMTVAFNGWIYVAYSYPYGVNTRGIQIRYSKDNGMNWLPFYTYALDEYDYSNFDIVVAGTDTNNLSLFIASSFAKRSVNMDGFFVNKHEANNPTEYTNSNYTITSGLITDIAMASDYLYPAEGASPFSIGLIYAMKGAPTDSINYIASIDGGVTFNYKTNIAQSTQYYRKVSLAYGRSLSASYGRYFAAWEQIVADDPFITGHIFTAKNETYVNDNWTTPVNLDSIALYSIGYCRNPTIAVQHNNIDNDSSSVSALVVFERDFSGNGIDRDIIGAYNMTASYTNNWTELSINSGGRNCIHPNISYDPAGNHFLAVYFDSTLKKLPYLVNGMNFNLTGPNAWLQITDKYNDSTNLANPWPKVQINPVFDNTAHVWVAEGPNNNGVVMFDAEYLQTGINEEPSRTMTNGGIYPNPVSEIATISFSTEATSDVTLQIFDISGKLVFEKIASDINSGNGVEKIDVRNWENGIYLFSISSNKDKYTSRFVVTH
jgi:hypothetical protein